MLLPSKTSKLPEDQQPFDPLTGMVITNSSNVTATPKGSCLVSRGWASGTRFLSEPTCLTHAVYSVPPISCTASFAATPILAKLPKGKQLQVRWAHLPSGAAPESFFICTCARARGSIIPPWLLWPYVGRCGVLRFVRIRRTGPSSSSEIWSTVRQAGATLRANRPALQMTHVPACLVAAVRRFVRFCSVCHAALFQGVIDSHGGDVRVRALGKVTHFYGNARNGQESNASSVAADGFSVGPCRRCGARTVCHFAILWHRPTPASSSPAASPRHVALASSICIRALSSCDVQRRIRAWGYRATKMACAPKFSAGMVHSPSNMSYSMYRRI
jgi:hypothetical protein